jgi:hypothetical protein
MRYIHSHFQNKRGKVYSQWCIHILQTVSLQSWIFTDICCIRDYKTLSLQTFTTYINYPTSISVWTLSLD